MVRILIVEDQKIMQKYFEYIIMQEPEFRHIQTVSDAREAVKICDYSAIDLVIMDVQTFHNHDGLSAGRLRGSAGRNGGLPGPPVQGVPGHGQPGRHGQGL